MLSLDFIDSRTGEILPNDENGTQRTKQYKGSWKVRVNEDCQGEVYLDGELLLALEKVSKIPNEWQIPNFYSKISELEQRRKNKEISWEDFIREKSKIEGDKKRVTGSGYVKAVLIHNNERICEKILIIAPGNLTEVEFGQMIKEIGQLAFSAVSCTHYS
jgi:hypothetical protein